MHASGHDTLDQEMQHIRQNRRLSILVPLLLVIGYTLYSAFFVKQISFSVQESSVSVADPFGHHYIVDLHTLTQKGFRTNMNYGNPVDGVRESGLLCGTWHTEELGDYHLCASESNRNCIILLTDDQTLVFNFGREEETEKAYEAMNRLLENLDEEIPEWH
ncbi:MAG: hypothetical protein II888_04475 [Clostridia bacterium]|nr:hypothetical protein [Clostridia bacterium]